MELSVYMNKYSLKLNFYGSLEGPYQYLGMTKIAGALNMLPQTMLRQSITNPSTNEAIEIYQADRLISSFLRFELKTNSPVEKFIIFIK
jgi:hypothetical protein